MLRIAQSWDIRAAGLPQALPPTLSGLIRWGLILLIVGFSLQFALREVLSLSATIVIWSDLVILGMLSGRIAELVRTGGGYRRSIELPLVALGMAACLSMLLNVVLLPGAANTLRLLFISPLLAALVLNLNGRRPYWTLVAHLALATLAFQAIVVIAQAWSAGFGRSLDAGQGLFGESAANSVGDCLVMAIAILFQRLLDRRLGMVGSVTLPLLIVAFVFASSRLGLVVLTVVTAIQLLRQGLLRPRQIAIAAVGGSAVVFLVTWYYGTADSGLAMLSWRREASIATTVSYGSHAPPRLLLIGWTWQTMPSVSRQPREILALVGLGPGMFGSFAAAHYDTPYRALIAAQFEGWGVFSTPALYSGYLAIFGELGLLGLMAVAWLLWRVGRGSWHAFRLAPDPFARSIAAGAVAAVLVLVLRGMVANVFEDRIVGFYAWLLIGMSLREGWRGRAAA
jgi:hypothetical protein